MFGNLGHCNKPKMRTNTKGEHNDPKDFNTQIKNYFCNIIHHDNNHSHNVLLMESI